MLVIAFGSGFLLMRKLLNVKLLELVVMLKTQTESTIAMSPSLLGWSLWNMCFIRNHISVLSPRIWRTRLMTGYALTWVAWQVSQPETDLLTLSALLKSFVVFWCYLSCSDFLVVVCLMFFVCFVAMAFSSTY